MAPRRKTRSRKSGGSNSGLNVGSALNNVIWILVGLVVGVPVMLAIFSDQGDEEGAFEGLTNLPTSGVLATNQYSGILSALILLIPLGIVSFFVFKYIESKGLMSGGGKKRSSRSRSRSRKGGGRRKRSTNSAAGRLRSGNLTDAQFARALERRGMGGGAPPAV